MVVVLLCPSGQPPRAAAGVAFAALLQQAAARCPRTGPAAQSSSPPMTSQGGAERLFGLLDDVKAYATQHTRRAKTGTQAWIACRHSDGKHGKTRHPSRSHNVRLSN